MASTIILRDGQLNAFLKSIVTTHLVEASLLLAAASPALGAAVLACLMKSRVAWMTVSAPRGAHTPNCVSLKQFFSPLTTIGYSQGCGSVFIPTPLR